MTKTVKKVKRRTIWTMGFAMLGDFGESQIANSMFPAIRDALGLSTSALGTITAVRRAALAISMPIWGAISDRYTRKGILMWITGVWGIWTLFTGFAQNYTQFLILTLISSIGLAAIDGPLSSLISDMFPVEERGKAFGTIKAIAYLAIAPTLMLFSSLAKQSPATGWRIAFWLFGGLSLLSALLIWLFIEEPVRGASEDALSGISEDAVAKEAAKNPFELSKIRTLFHFPTFMVILADRFLFSVPAIIIVAFSTTWFVDDLGIAPGDAIMFTLAGVMGLLLGSYIGGVVGGRQLEKPDSARRHLITGHLAQVGLAVAWLLTFGVKWSNVYVAVALLTLVAFFLEFRSVGIIKVVISRVMLPEVRSSGFGIDRTVDSVGRVIAALLIGQLADTMGIGKAAFSIGGVIVILMIAVYFLYYRFYATDAEAIQSQLATRAKS